MTTHAAPRIALDPSRIAAGAGAITLNTALLMLLLVPVAVPPAIELVRPEVIDYVLIRPKPPETPPEIVEVRRPTRDRPAPRPVEQPAPRPSLETATEAEPGDVVVPPGEGADPVGDTTGPIGDPAAGPPLEGAHLEYASAPPPPYPRRALREGLTGVVMLQVLVDVDGRPLEVSIKRSSGHRELDAAARRQVLSRWTFRPAVRDGRPVQAIGVVPVEFRLD